MCILYVQKFLLCENQNNLRPPAGELLKELIVNLNLIWLFDFKSDTISLLFIEYQLNTQAEATVALLRITSVERESWKSGQYPSNPIHKKLKFLILHVQLKFNR